MKRILLLLVLSFILTGCSITGTLEKIPNHEFTRFEYHRAGNATSTHIVATNAKKVDGKIQVEKATVSVDYGPFANFLIMIEGYKR